MYVSGGLRLSERSSENIEPHYDRMNFGDIFFFSEAHQLQKVCPYNRGVTKMMFRFYTCEFLILLFAFRLKRQRELLTKTVQVSVLVPPFFLLRVFFGPFCVFESLTLKMTGRHSLFQFCPQPPCPAIPLPPLPVLSRMIAGTAVYIELTGRALQLSNVQSLDQFYQVPRGTGELHCTRYSGFFVTKNPHSPRVWSAGVSSKVGRGGSRSTTQSSLCLDQQMKQGSLSQAGSRITLLFKNNMRTIYFVSTSILAKKIMQHII